MSFCKGKFIFSFFFIKFNFFLFYFRSKIQGLGLCAARDLEKYTMVIEYIGEVIRGELSEKREKDYESKVSFIFLL